MVEKIDSDTMEEVDEEICIHDFHQKVKENPLVQKKGKARFGDFDVKVEQQEI